METSHCPNYQGCQFLNSLLNSNNISTKNRYQFDYCLNKNANWKNCKRYITTLALNYCPDFVKPETELTPEEIINKYDQELI